MTATIFERDGFIAQVTPIGGVYVVHLSPPPGCIGQITERRATERGAIRRANELLDRAQRTYHQGVKDIIRAVAGGERLCRCNRVKDTGEPEEYYFLEPSGASCGPALARAAIASGRIKPSGDGLFGEAFSQTWVAP